MTKLFEMVQHMKKLTSSPLEHFLVLRVCQKCQKYTNSEKKTGFREFWLHLLNSKDNFYDVLTPNTFNDDQEAENTFSSNFFEIFEKKLTLQKLKFLMNLFFIIFLTFKT